MIDDRNMASRLRQDLTPWLSVEVSLSGEGKLRLRFEGELDLASSVPVRERLRQLTLARTPAILDFSGLTFVDCTGLRVILEALEAAGRNGAWLELSPEDPVALRRLRGLITKVADDAPATGLSSSDNARLGC